MLLEELFETEEKDKKEEGSYVGVKYSDDSCDRILEFAKSLELDNLITKAKIHSTIIYSTKPLPKDFKADGTYDEPIIVQPKELHIFKTQGGHNALVLKLDAPELKERHEYLMDTYDLSYSFDTFVSHLTISYNCEDYKIPKDIDLSSLKDLEVTKEYVEVLDLDWTSKK